MSRWDPSAGSVEWRPPRIIAERPRTKGRKEGTTGRSAVACVWPLGAVLTVGEPCWSEDTVGVHYTLGRMQREQEAQNQNDSRRKVRLFLDEQISSEVANFLR